jgi:ribose/xylose/arabinose/galactoside ABC-type transport system permease subunit
MEGTEMSLEMLKAIATTVALVLALVQALGMAQVRGYVRLLPFEKKRLRQWHRWGGIATLVLALAVAVTCVCGLGYGLYSTRLQAHAVMGALAILVLLLKVAITNRSRRYLRFNLALGAAAGLLVLGTFIASALWYFVQVA